MVAQRIVAALTHLLGVLAGSSANAGQDYQKYMHQYSDKYMGNTQNSTMLSSAHHVAGNTTGVGSSQDYKQYMQYAGKYMGAGSSGADQDYQQYMHQYAGKYMGDKNATMLNAKGHNATNSTGAGGAQDYQQYMKQYAGKYTGAGGYQKYMKQYAGGSSSGASSGQDYQQYMKQYAGKYMGDKNATMLRANGHGAANTTGAGGSKDYQQYMKQYAGSYDKYMQGFADNYMGGGDTSSTSSQDYQQYMHQFAGKYMGDKNATMLNSKGHGAANATGMGGAQDYQQYMHQYAGQYMGQYFGGNSSGSGAGQDYQQYMHQYADKYMGDKNATILNAQGHGGTNTTGGTQDYQQYMHQYADKYMGAGGYEKYMTQYAGNSSGGSGSGQDYQKYMSQYTGQAGPVALFSYAQSSGTTLTPADCTTWHCLCAWRDNQTLTLKHSIPAQYSSYALDSLEKEYGTHLTAFASNSSTSVKHLGLSKHCQPKVTVEETEQVPERPEAATTVAQLKAWREKQSDDLDKYVPSGFRHFAKESIENDYKKNLDRLKEAAHTKLAETKDDDSASPVHMAAKDDASAPPAPVAEKAAAAKDDASAPPAPVGGKGAAPATTAAPRRRWPFLAAMPTDLAEKAQEAAAEPAELADIAPEEAADPAPSSEVAPAAKAEEAAPAALEAARVAASEVAESGPRNGAVAFCVLAGLSLPALVSLAGSLASRRHRATVAVAQDPESLYEALMA